MDIPTIPSGTACNKNQPEFRNPISKSIPENAFFLESDFKCYTEAMLLDRIKTCDTFSHTERIIAEYILKHPDCILNNSAKELAALTYTSAPSIVRFCQKLGYSGYPELRLSYIEAYSKEDHTPSGQLDENSSLNDILKILPYRYEMVAKHSADRIDTMEFSQVVNAFRHAQSIDFYATGINYGIALAASIRFANLGYHAQVQFGVNKHYIQSLNAQARKKSLSFLISHTGTNEMVLEVARYLKSQNLPTVHLGRGDNELYTLSDYHIYWDNDRFDASYDNLSYPLSLMFILDVLYLELASIRKYSDPT